MSTLDANHETPTGTVLALAADLLFGSRIRAAASAANVPLLLARTPDELLRHAADARPRLIIIDLDTRSGDVAGAITRLKSDPATSATPVVAYAAHVNRPAIAAARDAGADRVLARSAFVKLLPDLLRNGLARDR